MKIWPSTVAEASGGMLAHKTLQPGVIPPPPAPPVPLITPSIEGVVPHLWPPGLALGANKIAWNVRLLGILPLIKEGHDAGALIPDITPVASGNVLYPLIWPFSSRKAMFSCAKVKVDGAAVAAMDFLFPMMTCGDPVSAPTPVVINLPKPVSAGLTWTDVLRGMLSILFEIGIEAVLHRIAHARGGGAAETVSTPSLRDVGSEWLGKLIGEAGKRDLHFAKVLLGAVSDTVIDVLCGRDPTFKLKTSAPGVELAVEVGGEGLSIAAQLGPAQGTIGPDGIEGELL